MQPAVETIIFIESKAAVLIKPMHLIKSAKLNINNKTAKAVVEIAEPKMLT